MEQELKQYESEHLALLINRQVEANKAIQQCVMDILSLRSLDITKYGVSSDLKKIVELPKPATVPEPALEQAAAV